MVNPHLPSRATRDQVAATTPDQAVWSEPWLAPNHSECDACETYQAARAAGKNPPQPGRYEHWVRLTEDVQACVPTVGVVREVIVRQATQLGANPQWTTLRYIPCGFDAWTSVVGDGSLQVRLCTVKEAHDSVGKNRLEVRQRVGRQIVLADEPHWNEPVYAGRDRSVQVHGLTLSSRSWSSNPNRYTGVRVTGQDQQCDFKVLDEWVQVTELLRVKLSSTGELYYQTGTYEPKLPLAGGHSTSLTA